MRLIALMTALLIAAPAYACINDRDTRRAQKEAEPEDPMQGLPPIPNVLRGRFDRYPDLYYEMRRDRVLGALEQDPNQIALYDDLAVAYDRLGDDEHAIDWMDRKLVLLENTSDKSSDEWKEHWYSYHANQGTFYAHNWIHNGANRANLAELLKARDLIAKAIAIKPNAHFGREKYQLMAINWIAETPEIQSYGELPNLLGLRNEDIDEITAEGKLKEKGLWDAVQGLSGLIVLGAAWESVDVTYALGIALRIAGDSENAYAAMLRCKELIASGKRSFVPGAPVGERLMAMLENALPAPEKKSRADAISLNYEMEREMAEGWQRDRNEKITALLKTGRHPDTDFAFWAEVDAIPSPKPENSAAPSERWLWFGLLGLVVAAIGGSAVTLIRRANPRQTNHPRA
ncbi:MAG: hypothetical protein KDA51_01070 [Planctomycetales bacterium]|nr:hypothetical protein [Planctomycetales bacterium]